MWHIITVPTRFETMKAMKTVVKCVIFLHNMVVEEHLLQVPAEEECNNRLSRKRHVEV